MISFSPSTSSESDTYKLTYSVLVKSEPDGRFSAVVLGLSDCKSSGNTENEALENLQQFLQKHLQNSKIVTLEMDFLQTDNPWLKVAGMYNDNPLFDEVLAEIEAERPKLDVEMEEKAVTNSLKKHRKHEKNEWVFSIFKNVAKGILWEIDGYIKKREENFPKSKSIIKFLEENPSWEWDDDLEECLRYVNEIR